MMHQTMVVKQQIMSVYRKRTSELKWAVFPKSIISKLASFITDVVQQFAVFQFASSDKHLQTASQECLVKTIILDL